MKRRAVLRVAPLLFATSLVGLAQEGQSATKSNAGQSSPPRQSAMNLLEEALAGTGSLTLPSNRLAIEVRAFPIVWSRNDARARALIQQMAADFAQAATISSQDSEQLPPYILNNLRNQRNEIARGIAASDAELALLFVSATLPHLKSISAEDDASDQSLVMELAAQIAQHNPQHALQLAEQQLKGTGDLPQSMINLLEGVQRNNPETGAHLFRSILDHLARQNLAEDTQALSFAASLLENQFSRQLENGKTDPALRTLAESVVAAALSSRIMETQPFILNGAMGALRVLVPGKQALLATEDADDDPADASSLSFWEKFNEARSKGNLTQAVALLDKAPEEARQRATAQVAWDFANNGELEHTRQVTQSFEPWQRNTNDADGNPFRCARCSQPR